MYKIQRRYMTLVEMMIVMFLIAMITGVIAYNYTGSLEEGKAFKTKTGIDKIHTILDLHLATHPQDLNNISTGWVDIVRSSALVKNSDDLVHDGWGGDYQVSVDEQGDIHIESPRYQQYLHKKGTGSLFNKDS